MVDHLKARLLPDVVDARHVDRHIEGQTGFVPQKARDLDYALRTHAGAGVAEVGIHGHHVGTETFAQAL
jgi:hypothetical protein